MQMLYITDSFWQNSIVLWPYNAAALTLNHEAIRGALLVLQIM